MYKNYAKKFTKKELTDQEIEIKFDERGLPHVFQRGQELKLSLHLKKDANTKFNYLCFRIFDLDKNGNRQIMEPQPNWKNQNNGYYVYRHKTILLHRAVWAWVYGEIPEGMVVNHIDNDCDRGSIENYKLSCLELLSVADNLNKYKDHRLVIKNKKKKYTIEELDKIISNITLEYEYYRSLGNKEWGDEIHRLRSRKSRFEALKRGILEEK